MKKLLLIISLFVSVACIAQEAPHLVVWGTRDLPIRVPNTHAFTYEQVNVYLTTSVSASGTVVIYFNTFELTADYPNSPCPTDIPLSSLTTEIKIQDNNCFATFQKYGAEHFTAMGYSVSIIN